MANRQPITLTLALAEEYRTLFERCRVKSELAADARTVAQKIGRGERRYRAVCDPLGIPWAFLGIVHAMEASFRWDRHVHNGDDPLTAPTVHEPRGEPRGVSFPCTWEVSADRALRLKSLQNWRNWTVAGLLFQFERYNGFGYRYRGEPSDYLWGASQIDRPGKFVADGKWDARALTRQVGAAVLLKELMVLGLFWPEKEAGLAPAVVTPAKPPATKSTPDGEPPEGWV